MKRSTQRVVFKPPPAGDPFSPYCLFLNCCTPISLCALPGMSVGAKLLYGRLCLYRGKGSRCNPTIKALADDLAVNRAKIERWLKELVDAKLIKRTRAGQGKAANVVFLWHPILSSSLLNTADMRYQAEAEHSDDLPIETGPETANTRDQASLIPQNLQFDTAPVRPPYKEQMNHEMKGESGGEDFGCPHQSATPEESAAAAHLDLIPSKKPPRADAGSGELSRVQNPDCEELDVPEDELSAVRQKLEEHGIKIPNAEIVVRLILLAREQGAGHSGLIAFIEFKARKRAPETAGFFLKSIPEDMPAWLKSKHGRELKPYVDPYDGYPIFGEPMCRKCNDTGIVGHSFSGPAWRMILGNEDRTAVRCDCVAGDGMREVYYIGPECRYCRGNLRWHHAEDTTERASCAACNPPLFQEEKPADAAVRLGAILGMSHSRRDCSICRETGIVKDNACTIEVKVDFCKCRHGQSERATRGDDWPASETQRLRAIEQWNADEDRKFNERYGGKPKSADAA